jgi:anti-sigma-K factor RskA
VRHPEPRELIRSMRKPGNLDEQGRPVYTLDERRSLTADIYENRVVKQTVENVQRRLAELGRDEDPTVSGEAQVLARVLEGARRQASFLDDVGFVARTDMPTATLTQDPLYRRMMAMRAELAD